MIYRFDLTIARVGMGELVRVNSPELYVLRADDDFSLEIDNEELPFPGAPGGPGFRVKRKEDCKPGTFLDGVFVRNPAGAAGTQLVLYVPDRTIVIVPLY